jgi:RNA polymerase sigma-70 factor (ECF subfamily)
MTEDLELLEAWRSGDQAAGNALVRKHFPIVYRFFSNKVGRGVEDLAQRTFLACVEARDKIPDGVSFRAYLLGIARYKLFHHLRHKRRHTDRFDFGDMTIEAIDGSPSQVVAEKEEQRVLLRALRRIPVEFQMTVELFYWEDLSVAEVAAVLDVAPGTVKSRLSRARDLLRTEIEALAESDSIRDSTIGDLDRWARSLRDVLDREKS